MNSEASNQAECIINSSPQLSKELSIKNLEFIFDNELYSGYINQSFGSLSYIYNYQQEPIEIHLKTLQTFDLTYHFFNRNFLQLDEYAGLIHLNSLNQILFKQYSFLIYAKYHQLITFTRLNLVINHQISSDKPLLQSIYEFKLYIPFVNNYTIGYLNKTMTNWMILNEHILPMISIENYSGRLFVKNRTLLLTNGNFYDFLIQDDDSQISRIQIIILTSIEPIYECILNHLNDKQLIGFIEIINQNQTNSMCDWRMERSFELLNYNHLFFLDRQHGLLYYQNQSQRIDEDLLLLIQIDSSRCLVTIDHSTSEVLYRMIRNGSQLQREIKEQYHIDKSSGQFKFVNGTSINYDIIPSQSPIFPKKSYEFSLNLSNTKTNQPIYIGQISAVPYNINRSHLVYEFVNRKKHFLVHIDRGILEYIPNEYYNETMEQFQIMARDLIYQENTTINITIHIIQPERISLPSLIYHRTVSEILPPGSVIFQPNISSIPNLRYSLRDYHSNLFQINPFTGQVTLLNYLSDQFYSFKIHLFPMEEILIIRLTVIDYNNHPPQFFNLPLNLSISSSESFITKLSANDLDLQDNRNLRYYLLDSDYEKIFSLNQSTGILTFNGYSPSKSFYQLNLGVSDGLYLTKNYLQIHLFNYSQHSPSFSSNEYIFQYDQTREHLGQISAYDLDVNDRIVYELYLQPNEIQIDASTGLIKMTKKIFFKPVLEFFASAMDLAKQIVYTKIKIIYSIQPKFQSNLFFINLIRKDLIIPSEIFELEIVDSFNQPLNSAKFQIKNQTNFFTINENKLIIQENFLPSNDYFLNINAYWKNFIIQTSIQIQFVDKLIQFEKKFYQYSIDKSFLKENDFIEKFPIENLTLKIVPTSLTRNDCQENFYIKLNQIFFKTFPILSDLCFFELQLTDHISSSSSQIQISFIHSNIPPKFSSKIYYFHQQNLFRVFANGSNVIRYRLQNNSYGLFINQTDGVITWKYDFNENKNIQLFVYAIDEKTNLYDTALVEILFHGKTSFQIPNNYSEVLSCSNIPIRLSEQSLPGTVIQDISNYRNNLSNIYYILSGDLYGLFAINNLGQLYLTSPILNQTSEEYFSLIILISSVSSMSYCRTNISIHRTPKWAYLICPAVSE